jgi:hypothetical protein
MMHTKETTATSEKGGCCCGGSRSAPVAPRPAPAETSASCCGGAPAEKRPGETGTGPHGRHEAGCCGGQAKADDGDFETPPSRLK